MLQNQEDQQQELHNNHSIFQSSGIIPSFDNINDAFKKRFDDRWRNTFWERQQCCCCCTTKDDEASKTGGCRGGGGVLSITILELSLKSEWRSLSTEEAVVAEVTRSINDPQNGSNPADFISYSFPAVSLSTRLLCRNRFSKHHRFFPTS